MLLLGIDFETTGVHAPDCHIIEIGVSLYNPEMKLVTESHGILVNNGVVIPAEITQITGITQEAVYAHGRRPESALQYVEQLATKATAWAAHNADFERDFIKVHMPDSRLLQIPCLDTMKDIPYPSHVKHRDLERLGLSHGCPNLMAHRASPDVLAMFEILKRYDWEDVEAYWKEPAATFKAVFSPDDYPDRFNDPAFHACKDLVKSLGFKWDKPNGQWIFSARQREILEACQAVNESGLNVTIVRVD
jgi:DNA polymerase III epsilon subunit-like protein